jgi:hypothetical protein
MSRCQAGQLSGSLAESSGWGSRMILPSGVFFFGVSWGSSGNWLITPVGMDEWDVLAGALRSPRGSLWSEANNNTEPIRNS